MGGSLQTSHGRLKKMCKPTCQTIIWHSIIGHVAHSICHRIKIAYVSYTTGKLYPSIMLSLMHFVNGFSWVRRVMNLCSCSLAWSSLSVFLYGHPVLGYNCKPLQLVTGAALSSESVLSQRRRSRLLTCGGFSCCIKIHKQNKLLHENCDPVTLSDISWKPGNALVMSLHCSLRFSFPCIQV